MKSFYFTSLLLIVVLCSGLFLLDKDTRSAADLLKTGNLFALLLYVIPTYLICAALFHLFDRKGWRRASVAALSIGIPAGLTLVITILSAAMGRI